LGEPIGRCRQRDAIPAEQAFSKVISTTCSMEASTEFRRHHTVIWEFWGVGVIIETAYGRDIDLRKNRRR